MTIIPLFIKYYFLKNEEKNKTQTHGMARTEPSHMSGVFCELISCQPKAPACFKFLHACATVSKESGVVLDVVWE